jgi:hypothetical protein
LSLEFAPGQPFDGSLQIWETPSTPLTLSRLRSSQLGYSRSKAQVSEDHEAFYLVTVPRRSEVHFEQDGRQIIAARRIHLRARRCPYRFHYGTTTTSGCSSCPNVRCMANLLGPSAIPGFASMPAGPRTHFRRSTGDLCARHFDMCPRRPPHAAGAGLSTLLLALQHDERVLGSEGRTSAPCI